MRTVVFINRLNSELYTITFNEHFTRIIDVNARKAQLASDLFNINISNLENLGEL